MVKLQSYLRRKEIPLMVEFIVSEKKQGQAMQNACKSRNCATCFWRVLLDPTTTGFHLPSTCILKTFSNLKNVLK